MEPISLASLFNAALPSKLVIIVQNSTGLALNSSGGGVLYFQTLNTTTA
jgi:hypothetical protein